MYLNVFWKLDILILSKHLGVIKAALEWPWILSFGVTGGICYYREYSFYFLIFYIYLKKLLPIKKTNSFDILI